MCPLKQLPMPKIAGSVDARHSSKRTKRDHRMNDERLLATRSTLLTLLYRNAQHATNICHPPRVLPNAPSYNTTNTILITEHIYSIPRFNTPAERDGNTPMTNTLTQQATVVVRIASRQAGREMS